MRIIEKYVEHSILRIFLSSVLVFCFLYVVIELTTTIDEIIDRKIPFNILLQYYSSFMPIIFIRTSSFCCLIATMFTFSALNNNNEIIAMRASGLSFWKIAKPALIFGVLVSMLVFWINEKYVPQATIATKQIREANMVLQADRAKRAEKIENITFYGLQKRIYFVDSYSPKKQELNGIVIIGFDENQNIRNKIAALRGVWTGLAWKFYNCQITEFDPESGRPIGRIKVYTEKLMDIKEKPADFMEQRLDIDSMNINQLKDYIVRFEKSGATRAINNLRVDLHKKIAYPFSNIVIVLLGLPFALMIRSRKGATFTSLGIAVAIGFLFHVSYAMSLAFGKGEALPPIVAAWITPVIFTIMGLIVIKSDFAN